MLAGTRHLMLDAKGRVVMPAPFRKHLGQTIVLSRGPEAVILAFSERQWRAYIRAQGWSETFTEYFISGAWTVTPQPRTGRITLPSWLREHAKLRSGAEVAVAGLGTAVVICARNRWDARMRYQEKRVLASLAGPEFEQVPTYAHYVA